MLKIFLIAQWEKTAENLQKIKNAKSLLIDAMEDELDFVDPIEVYNEFKNKFELLGDKLEKTDYTRILIQNLMECHLVYTVTDWSTDTEAVFLWNIAKAIGIKIIGKSA